MNEFLTKLCSFLKDFPDNQVSIPWGSGELYIAYVGPQADIEESEYTDISTGPSEGLRVPNCEHKGRLTYTPPPVGAGEWVSASVYAARHGGTYQNVGKKAAMGLIQREKRGPKYVYFDTLSGEAAK